MTKASPLELWNGTLEDRVKAHQRLVDERNYRNKRRVYPAKFYPGQVVLLCGMNSRDYLDSSRDGGVHMF